MCVNDDEIASLKQALRSAHRAVRNGEKFFLTIQRNMRLAKQMHGAGRKRQSRELLDETLSAIDEFLATAEYHNVHAATAALLGENDNGGA